MSNSFMEFNSLTNVLHIEPATTKVTATSPMVEIFSAVVNGSDTQKFGTKVDAVLKHVKELAEKARVGDAMAKHEYNTIVQYIVEPKLANEIKLFNFMGTYKEIGYDETPMVKTYKHESIDSKFQAAQGDVTFGTQIWSTYPITTKTISAGYTVNYREVASGNLDKVAEGIQQVKVDMMNKAMLYVINVLYNSIKNATGIKYFSESAGISKASVDAVIKNLHPFGRPSLMGSYSAVVQLNPFAGFKADATDTKNTFLSEAVMNEIRSTGLLTTYNGAPVVELPNKYNMSKINTAGNNFKLYLPEGILFAVPQGEVAPLQIFKKGGIQSMTGSDVVTGTEMTRFDMEFGADVAKGREFEIGMVSDTTYDIEVVG